MSEALKAWLSERAIAAGFDAVGFTPAADHDFSTDLEGFLAKNYEGDMGWLSDRKHWRSTPSTLWPEARSIIMLAEKYPAATGRADLQNGEISTYARGCDYHDVVKKRLKLLGRELIAHAGGEIKVFVDTAPVMEKPLAAAAGLGWQGKHGNLVSRDLGSWFFLGAIFTTHEMTTTAPMTNHCGSCRACLDVCPTFAFDDDGHLDARKCISYLTIEYAGSIAEPLRSQLGNRIYGCDLCLDACPWNKFAIEGHDARLAHREDLISPPLTTLLALDDAAFRTLFSGSPIKRIGHLRFIRNCLYAAGNSRDIALQSAVKTWLNHADSTIAEAAQWAIEKLEASK